MCFEMLKLFNFLVYWDVFFLYFNMYLHVYVSKKFWKMLWTQQAKSRNINEARCTFFFLAKSCFCFQQHLEMLLKRHSNQKPAHSRMKAQ